MSYAEKLKDPRWQNCSGIYKLIINKKIYIGSAIDLPKRLRSHYNGLISKKHVNRHLQNSFNKYNSIDFEIIEFVDNPEYLLEREQFYFDTMHPQMNIAKIAGNQLGLIHSKETRKKISAVQKGKKLSDETKKRMSISKKGVAITDEHKKNISLAKIGNKNPFYKAGKNHPQFGKHKSDLTKLRISNSLKNSGLLAGPNNPA